MDKLLDASEAAALLNVPATSQTTGPQAKRPGYPRIARVYFAVPGGEEGSQGEQPRGGSGGLRQGGRHVFSGCGCG